MFKHDKTKVIDHGPMGWALFTAWMGAVVYFVQQSEGFFGFIWAIIKSIVWPAFLIYNGLQGLAA